MMRSKLIMLLVLMQLACGPASAQTSEVRLSSDNVSDATLRFSCELQDYGISVDLDNPPAEFIDQEEVIGVFDDGTPNAFSLHGFSISTDERHARLMLDPSYRTAVTDALEGLEQASSDHNLTVIAPKSSFKIRWPLTSDLIARLADNYRRFCPNH